MTTKFIRDEGAAPSRLAAVCGVAYALLWLASGFFSPEGPADETATPGGISAFLSQSGPTLGVGVTGLLAWGLSGLSRGPVRRPARCRGGEGGA